MPTQRELAQIMPAWFTDRMMNDRWRFGLLMSSGIIIPITHIVRICSAFNDTIWLDVEMVDRYNLPSVDSSKNLFSPPCSRTQATINAAHIVAAFELTDT